MINTAANTQELSQHTTAELKQQLLQLTGDRDIQPLKQKVEYYQQQLEPIVTELSRRNPFPQPEDQVPHILGVQTPLNQVNYLRRDIGYFPTRKNSNI